MKPNWLSTTIGEDRLATPDELLAADLCDPIEDLALDLCTEIPCDTGGYVRIRSVDLEIAEMVGAFMQKEHEEAIE
jgi:hypothetical protein